MRELTAEKLAEILEWAARDCDPALRSALSAAAPAAWQSKAARAISQYFAGAPLGYVLGEVRYLGRTFRCDRRALAIRPYNGLIVRRAVEDWAGRGPRGLEIGCGAGATIISLALELEGVFVGTDIDEAALELARENAAALGATVDLFKSDLFEAVGGEFDFVVSNLPREDPARPIPEEAWEPRRALYDTTGAPLGLYRRLLAGLPGRLRPGGLTYLEVPSEPERQVYFVGEPLRLADGEIIAYRMDAAQAAETMRRLEEAFGN